VAGRDWYCEDVLSGNMEVKRVWEDDQVLAFHHPEPQADIHVAVIPREHIRSILDPDALDGALLSSLVMAVKEAAHQLGLDKQGFYVPTKAGSDGVPHNMHMHIVGSGIP
jgi:histidine triad (HIT) family protein